MEKLSLSDMEVYVKVSVNRLIKANDSKIEELVASKDLEDGDKNTAEEDKDRNVDEENDKDEMDTEKMSDRLRSKDPVNYKDLHKGKVKDIGMVEIYITTIPKEDQNNTECFEARMAELKKLKEYDVNQEVSEEGQTLLSTRWVMTLRDGKPRARLVVRGFEEEELVQKDSPTVSKSAMRLLFTVAASKPWAIRTTDIKSAFLQGKELDRIVHVKPPKEARTDQKKVAWRLRKCLYGLNDASRQFYLAVKEVLIACGCRQSSVEPTLFYLHDDKGDIRGALVSHIDDFLHGGDSYFEREVIKPLIRRFTAGKAGVQNFTYVGFQVSQDKNGITMDQNQYINGLTKENWQTFRGRDRTAVLTDAEQTEYRAIIGSINWCVRNSRPDVAFELTELSTKMRTATVGDWQRALKCIKKLQASTSQVFYPGLSSLGDMRLEVFSDASFANLSDGVSSAMGYAVFATNDNKACSLGWRSGKVKRVVKSTLAAEALALSEGLGEAMYLQKMVSELLGICPPIIAHVDSKGLVDQLHSTKLVMERMLRIDIGIIKEMLERKQLMAVRWCSTDQQPADVLTKRGADGSKLLTILAQGEF